MATIKQLSSISEIINRYDAFILDLWGVIHDGLALYPTARATLRQLKQSGKRMIFLSNAPRRAAAAIAKLEALGIDSTLYERVITSGEAAFEYLSQPSQRQKWGRNCYYIGLPMDKRLLFDLGDLYSPAEDVGEADFVICAGYESFTQRPESIHARLEVMKQRDLPMLCINPDIEVVRQNGERILCAGHLARIYEEMGGNVSYIGKPHALVYESCLAHFSAIPRRRILAVGDSISTDIAGAVSVGVDSVLVSGGILRSQLQGDIGKDNLLTLCNRYGAQPDYMLAEFT